MKLYLVQHAKALSKDENPDRPLSDAGKADLEKVVKFARPMNLTVENIWHSVKLRAKETAETLSQTITANKGVSQRDGLKAKDDVSQMKNQILAAAEDTMLVGHQPFMGKMASLLLTGTPENDHVVGFEKGGIVCFNYTENGNWQLDWMVTPDIIACC
jgi:phosphohistidine phosphatase